MSAVVPGAEIFIPLDDIMDYEAELDRLQEGKEEAGRRSEESQQASFPTKALSARRLQKVVEEEKAKQVKYEEMLAKVCDRLGHGRKESKINRCIDRDT